MIRCSLSSLRFPLNYLRFPHKTATLQDSIENCMDAYKDSIEDEGLLTSTYRKRLVADYIDFPRIC